MSTAEHHLEYVGFWARAGAGFIDSIITMAVTLPLTFLVYTRALANPDATSLDSEEGADQLGPAGAVRHRLLGLEGATPGKMAHEDAHAMGRS